MDIPRETKRSKARYLWALAGAVVLVLITAALWRLEPAAPAVDRATIWTDTVQRGEMVRQVRGPGTLVPEQARWVVAQTAGRVERVFVQPGEAVDPGTVLMELSNPDVQVEGLDAERQLAAVEAQLADLRSTLETQRLNQASQVAQVRSEYREAMRRLESTRQLAERNLIPRNDLARAQDQAEELATRLELEERRLEVIESSIDERLNAQRGQVQRLRAISEFQHRRAASMRVSAGAAGVVQDLDLEIGQWVMPGQTLARVVSPDRLKAELRIPETQARDLSVGQLALVDTRNGVVEGRVARIDPAVQNGAVLVEVSLPGELPRGARPDLSVEGTIQIERLKDVLHVGRPAYGQPNSLIGMWKVVENGRAAIRVPVRLGRSSVNTIEILEGLEQGETVILSDLSSYDDRDRLQIK